MENAEEIICFEDIGKEVNVYGGMAEDDFTFSERFVFIKWEAESVCSG